MNQQGIEIHECKHNTTHIRKQDTLRNNKNKREFTTINNCLSCRSLPKLTFPSLSQGTLNIKPNA